MWWSLDFPTKWAEWHHEEDSQAAQLDEYSVADPREGPGGPPPPLPPLFLDQTEAQRAKKNVFETPPPLSQGLNDRAPFPPYLKVWIRHWKCQCTNAIEF